MKISRRTLGGGFAALAGTALLPGAGEAQTSEKRTIALLFDSLQSAFWIESLAVMRSTAAQRGWATLEAISNLDDNKQFEQVQSMIQRKVDGIVIIQTDANAVIPAIRAANAANIPMVHYNRPPAPSDAYSVAVVADNRAIMQNTVSSLIESAKRQGGTYKACILIGDLGDQNAIKRRDGFFDIVNQHKDLVEVVARVATQWNADVAFAGLTNALQANPDINFLVTSSDFLDPQIEQALKVADKWHQVGETGHVVFGSFDGDAGGYQRLADGYLDADGVQNVFVEVNMTFDALTQMWAGKKPPRVLVDPGFVITHANMLQTRDQMWGYAVWKQKKGG
jgi:ABC-type sugar transport system substrate-binding protein